VHLTREEIDRSLRASFPGAPIRVLDVDEVAEDRLVVVLADLSADCDEPFLWATAFKQYENGWFEVLAAEGDNFVYSTPEDTTIAIASGLAPTWAERCAISLLGQRRERRLHTRGFYLVGFFEPSARELDALPTPEFS
jgi:hypothetical protein